MNRQPNYDWKYFSNKLSPFLHKFRVGISVWCVFFFLLVHIYLIDVTCNVFDDLWSLFFYVWCQFRTLAIMPDHNVLIFVDLNNYFISVISPP